ncbi:MAG: hypothetical protein Q6373_011360 [Candidatus Sigynarchaeota archaeon]
MEKPDLLKLLPAILGFAGLAIPAFSARYPVVFWVFGGYASDSGFDMINFASAGLLEDNPKLLLILVSAILLAVGAVLALLSGLGVLKMGKVAWLPGVLMIAALPLYMIGTWETEILEAAPIVVNLICGAVGGVWSIVNAVKANK